MHGMVTVGGEAVKSSRGDPLLIDELLDQLIGRPELHAVREEHTRCDLDSIAVMTALGAVLAHPLSKRLDLTFDQLVSERSSAGWALARAWADAWHPRHDGKPDPAPDDVRYRYLVVQSQIHRGLARALPAAPRPRAAGALLLAPGPLVPRGRAKPRGRAPDAHDPRAGPGGDGPAGRTARLS